MMVIFNGSDSMLRFGAGMPGTEIACLFVCWFGPLRAGLDTEPFCGLQAISDMHDRTQSTNIQLTTI